MSKQAKFGAALALTAALALPAWAQEAAEGESAGEAAAAVDVTADTVVATVNGAEITIGHMIAARETLPAQYQALPDEVLFDGILDQIVQQTVLAAVGEQSISRRDELVMENERRAYLAGSVLDQTATAAVTDEAIQGLYDERYAGAEPQKEFNAAHILVETEEAAQAIKDRIDAGEDFTAIAREESTGPSGGNGGDLGWFGLGMMVPPFEEAVVGMEPGEVSGPVQTQFGWHVIRLNETRMAEAPTIEDVREEITGALQQEAVEARVNELVEAAEVTRATEGVDPAVLKNIALLDE